MPRFFAEILEQGRAIIKGKDVAHIKGSLRMGVGDRILIRDNAMGYGGIISSVVHDSITVDIEGETPLVDRSTRTVRLAIGIVALKDMDTIVRFVTELGVSEIIPVMASRSNIPSISKKRYDRWQLIIMEAVKQSERRTVPTLHNALGMADFVRLASARWPSRFFGHKGCEFSLADITHDDVGIIIGPEGGFTANEIKVLSDNAFRAVNMGRTTLRSITAAITAASILGTSARL